MSKYVGNNILRGGKKFLKSGVDQKGKYNLYECEKEYWCYGSCSDEQHKKWSFWEEKRYENGDIVKV